MHVLSSTLDRVTVYARGATVYRSIVLKRPKAGWPRHIEIPQLPLALDDATVRLISQTHQDKVRIIRGRVGIHVKPREHDFDTPEESHIQRMERQLHHKGAITDDLKAEIRFFESFTVPQRPVLKGDRPPPASPMLARLSLTTFMNDAISKRETQLRALRGEMDKITRELEQARDAQRRHSTAKHAQVEDLSKTFMAELVCDCEDDAIELRLEYFIPGARWAPQYQCHIKRDGSQATMTMRAIISQNSGEDWRNVHLSLSTAYPGSWTSLPKLRAIRVGKHQPPPPQQAGFRPPPKGAAMLFGDVDRDRQVAQRHTPSPQHVYAPVLNKNTPESFAHLMAGVQLPSDVALDSLRQESPMVEASYEEEYDELEELDDMISESAVMDDSFGGYEEKERVSAPRRKRRSAPAPKMAKAMAAAPPAPGAIGGSIGSRGAYKLADAIPEPPEVKDFARLKLGDPTDPSRRNRLHVIEQRDVYQKSFARTGLQLRVDLVSLVQQASQQAAAVAQNTLPRGSMDVRMAADRFDYIYDTRDRVDVPSDGTFHSVPVDTRTMDCALHYVVVPREDTQVYRIASLTNPSQSPLLSGQAELYVGGEFVLTTQLVTVAPRAQFKLGLGVEQGIRCARNTVFEETRSGRAIVATAELWHTLEITLHNQLAHPVQCEVRERIPQPDKDAEVVVEEGEVSPSWTSYDQVDERKRIRGGRKWSVTLPPHEPQTLKAQYVVKIYANNELVGGNRRER